MVFKRATPFIGFEDDSIIAQLGLTQLNTFQYLFYLNI